MFEKRAEMRPMGAGGEIGASWAGGRQNFVVGVRARMQAREADEKKLVCWANEAA